MPIALLALSFAAGCDRDDGGAGDARAGARSDAARPRAPVRPARETAPAVTRAGVEEHLSALQAIADRHGGNRAAGTAGDAASRRYVSARLREAGFRVRLQPLRFPFFRVRSARLAADGRALARGRDFRLLTYSGSGRVEAAGRGCARGDFRDLGRAAIARVERGDCTFRTKALNAQRAGAAAMLLVDPAGDAEPLRGTLGAPGVRIPALVLGAEAAGRLAAGQGARLAVDAVAERRLTHNVIADGPAGGGRVLMAGGHLDSVLAGPGLNDNGSGVAALLELAEALGARPGGTAVRLGFWAAEELGLYGSRHYVRGLSAAERRRHLGYVNLDMVGSPNAVLEVYDGAHRIERALQRALPEPAPLEGLDGGSDHAPFRRAGIPVGGLFTGASADGPGGRPRDPCYHRRCDTIDNVDRAVLLEAARAAAAGLASLRRQAK